MKTNKIKIQKRKFKHTLPLLFAVGAVLCLQTAHAGDAEKGEVKVPIAKVPAKAKATLMREAKGAKIRTVDKEAVYEADVKIDGKLYAIVVSGDDAELLSKKVDTEDSGTKPERPDKGEVRMSFDKVPAAVKAVFLREAKGAKIHTVDKGMAYEADAKINGQNYEIIVAADDGDLLSKKVDNEGNEKGSNEKGEKGEQGENK